MESEAQADQFDRLFRSTFRRVMAYCLRRTGETAAQDAVAEVYAVAWRKRRHLPAEENDAALWLLGVARNVLANQARGQNRLTRLLLRAARQPAAPPAPPPESRYESTGPEAGLTAALAQLPAADQEILRLSYWEELPHTDIAVVLGVSTGAVTTRLHRARQRLRARLTTGEGERPEGGGGAAARSRGRAGERPGPGQAGERPGPGQAGERPGPGQTRRTTQREVEA